jgi:hypothetical protein
MSRGQGSCEGGRGGQHQKSGAGDDPAPQAAEQKEQARDHRERGERGADPPEQLGGYKGSRIPEESPASTRERRAEKQAHSQ